MDQSAPSTHEKGAWLAPAFFWVPAVYLVPLGVVLVDERMLKTFWFIHHLPSWVIEVFRVMYPFAKYIF